MLKEFTLETSSNKTIPIKILESFTSCFQLSHGLMHIAWVIFPFSIIFFLSFYWFILRPCTVYWLYLCLFVQLLYFVPKLLCRWFIVARSDPGYLYKTIIKLEEPVNNGEDYHCKHCDVHVLQVAKKLYVRHCCYCQRCVLSFDHHCPWIANCIGAKNTAAFLRMLSAVRTALLLELLTLLLSCWNPTCVPKNDNELLFVKVSMFFAVLFMFLVVHLFKLNYNEAVAAGVSVRQLLKTTV